MLRPIDGLPEGVLGYQATGEIQASDYGDVLMPAVKEVWDRGEEVRIVLVFEQWEGMSPGAAWDDLKMGFKNLRKWKRIALVTDLDWMITVTSLFGWMTPGELERFPVAERDAAIAWAAARLSHSSPVRKPSRQEANRGCHPNSRLAFAFDAPRTLVIITTPVSPTNSRASHAGIRRGGGASSAVASSGSHTDTGAGSSSVTL